MTVLQYTGIVLTMAAIGCQKFQSIPNFLMKDDPEKRKLVLELFRQLCDSIYKKKVIGKCLTSNYQLLKSEVLPLITFIDIVK